jgi:hypothetical protein
MQGSYTANSHPAARATLVIAQDPASGLWNWVLESEDAGPIARSPSGFKTRPMLVEELLLIRTRAPQSLIFDIIGNLHPGR